MLCPQLIKSLKKAIEPAVSDITIDWYVPDTMEALLSPNEIAALYPGDRLISYCTLYHIASFRDKKATVEQLFPSKVDDIDIYIYISSLVSLCDYPLDPTPLKALVGLWQSLVGKSHYFFLRIRGVFVSCVHKCTSDPRLNNWEQNFSS